MPLYLLRMSLDNLSFRIPCLLSVAQTFGFPIRFISEDVHRGVLVVELEKEEHLQHLLDRATLLLFASELLASAPTYSALHAHLRAHPSLVAQWGQASFKFFVEAANHSIPIKRQVSVIEGFSYLPLEGKIEMKNPEVEFLVFEDYDLAQLHNTEMRLARDGQFRQVYFARRIGPSRARPLVQAYSVKTRSFYGNTSMDAEMGFLMSLQALPAPGKIVYDPFAGTGSMLLACAQWGAFCFGSDVDARQMRGKNKGKGVVPGMYRAADQYGTADLFLDCLTYDVTQNPLRRGGWIDAIVTDPPYGVRAGGKRQGKKKPHLRPAASTPFLLPDGSPAHQREGYLPPMKPYDLVSLTYDLISLARYLLVPGGRLVFFLPTVTDEYDAIDVPFIEGMRELKVGEGSVQDFGKWGRRLITMEKVAGDDGPRPEFEEKTLQEGERRPGHHDFNHRAQYYEGFVPRD